MNERVMRTGSARVRSGVSPEVASAWQTAVARWDRVEAHDALLGVVARHRCFLWLAMRYKERGEDPIAARQMRRLRQAAFATLMGAEPSTKPKIAPSRLLRSSIGVLFIIAVMVGVGLAYAKTMDRMQVPGVIRIGTPT